MGSRLLGGAAATIGGLARPLIRDDSVDYDFLQRNHREHSFFLDGERVPSPQERRDMLGGLVLSLVGPAAAEARSAVEAERIASGIRPYNALESPRPVGFQANHLNQNGAYGGSIPPNDGLSLMMRGDAFADPASPHGQFHEVLDRFWAPYQKGGELEGQIPENWRYDEAMQQGLSRAGYSRRAVARIADRAAEQRETRGLAPNDPVPRVPKPIRRRGR
jgi:hypothetical protein